MRAQIQLIAVGLYQGFYETETGTDTCHFWAKAKVNSIYRDSAPEVYFSLPYSTMVWIEVVEP